MAARVQQNSVPSSQQRRPGSELPPYETPAFPLNQTADRTLGQLYRTHRLERLEESMKDAQLKLSKAAGELNDRLYNKEQAQRKRLERMKRDAAEGEAVGDADGELKLNIMREKVQSMTQRMDDSMRKLIDGQHNLESINKSITKTSENARAHASSQPSRSQPRPESGSGSDSDGEEYPDFTPTDPAGGTQTQQRPPPPLDVFRSEMQAEKTRYEDFSLTARYALNSSYRDFRRVVHDARYPNDEVQLPHHSEWFDDTAVPDPGVVILRNADDGDGGDEDIAISRATISTRCPITLTELREPLMSRKCPHVFESDSITSLLAASQLRIPPEAGRRGRPAVQCPVTGCTHLLTKEDLQVDAVVLRKIRRIQRRRLAEDDDAEDGESTRSGATHHHAQLIDEDDEETDPDEMAVDEHHPLKSEPRGSRGSIASTNRA